MKNTIEDINSVTHKLIMAIMFVVTVITLELIILTDLEALPATWIMTLGLDCFCMIVCQILVSSCILEKRSDEKNEVLIQFIFLICLNLFFDALCWILDGHGDYANHVKFANTMFYSLGVISSLVFWNYIRLELSINEKKYKKRSIFIYAVVAFEIISVIINWKYGFYFVVDGNGVYSRASGGMVYNVLEVVVLGIMAFTIASECLRLKEKLIVLSYLVFPCVGFAVQILCQGLSVILPSMLLAVILIYNYIHLNRSRIIMEQEATLSKQNVALMISQIQPHFLYNVLTTISNLCRKNPAEAEETTVMFAQYLRMNLDSLKRLEPIPFTLEFRHIQIYLTLEQKRFGERLNVVYNVEEEHFLVPALSLQPIVENSVKHGICEKGEPGTLTFTSKKVDGGYQIIIEDDGVGFDPNVPHKEDGRSHVGMNNVENRLLQMSQATMEVISSPGNGCKTIITFPESGQKKREEN